MWRRVQAHWRQKLWLTVALNALFWLGYSWLGRRAFFPLHTVPLTWFDTRIPFQSTPWGWVYLSQFLFTSTLPWLIDTRDGLRRFVVAFGVMSVVSFAIFVFFPVASPRPPAMESSGAMAVITAYDGTLNAFPSLHAAFLVLMMRLAWRLFGASFSMAAKLAALTWGAAILYATIATRQHYALDLVAGAAVGAAADWVAWRGYGSPAAAMTIERSRAVASQAGCK